jgi:hypothetical protein
VIATVDAIHRSSAVAAQWGRRARALATQTMNEMALTAAAFMRNIVGAKEDAFIINLDTDDLLLVDDPRLTDHPWSMTNGPPALPSATGQSATAKSRSLRPKTSSNGAPPSSTMATSDSLAPMFAACPPAVERLVRTSGHEARVDFRATARWQLGPLGPEIPSTGVEQNGRRPTKA